VDVGERRKVRLMAKRGENFVSVEGADGRKQVRKP